MLESLEAEVELVEDLNFVIKNRKTISKNLNVHLLDVLSIHEVRMSEVSLAKLLHIGWV